MAHMLLKLLKQHLTSVVNLFYQCGKKMKASSNFSDQKVTKPSSKIFYRPFQGGTSFVDFFFCLVFAMPL